MPCVDNFVVGHAFRSVPFGTIEHCLAEDFAASRRLKRGTLMPDMEISF
jgi:hypothetical protein